MINQRIFNYKRKKESIFFTFTKGDEADFYVKAFGIWKNEDVNLIRSAEEAKFSYGIKLTDQETIEDFIKTYNTIRDDIFEYTKHNNGAPTLSKDYLVRRYEDEKFQRVRRRLIEFADESD